MAGRLRDSEEEADCRISAAYYSGRGTSVCNTHVVPGRRYMSLRQPIREKIDK